MSPKGLVELSTISNGSTQRKIDSYESGIFKARIAAQHGKRRVIVDWPVVTTNKVDGRYILSDNVMGRNILLHVECCFPFLI
jgi:hypothetical protein